MRKYVLLTCLLLSFFAVFSCKKEPGKVIVTEKQFQIRQDNPNSYVVDATGEIKNIGHVPVKNVVVTGSCPSCTDTLAPRRWFVSKDIEKTPEQKATIAYLAVGQEASFSFKGVAFLYDKEVQHPEMPEELDIVIKSFEPAD